MFHFRDNLRSIFLLVTFSVLLPVSAQQVKPTANLSLDEAAAAVGRTGFQGILFAARGNKVLMEKTYGSLAESSQTFRFASITKMMTAIIVMQEVEAGHIKLDQPLGSYWPDYPNPQVRAVTIRQFLTHYSGLFNTSAQPNFHMMNANSGGDMQKFATGICAGPMNSVPGTNFDYNNCDYMVIGALLERMTKQPFIKLLQQRIFVPSKMLMSGYYTEEMPDNPAHIHGILGGKPEPDVNLASYGAAGSSFGTLRDMFAFDRAFIKGKLISQKTRDEMIKPNAVGGAIGVWTYPFKGVDEQKPVTIVERQGWIAGIRILNLIDLQSENVLIIVSTNGDLDLTQTWTNKGVAANLLSALITTKVAADSDVSVRIRSDKHKRNTISLSDARQ